MGRPKKDANMDATAVKEKKETTLSPGPNGTYRMYARILYIEPILGTCPSDPEIARRFIASKAPDAPTQEEEIAAIGTEGVIGRTMTIFPVNAKGVPIHWDYQWKGHAKDSWQALKKVEGSVSSKISAGKKMVDKLIFPGPRRIPIIFNGKMEICERPLRANTPMGERVSLAMSEQIPAGAYSDVYFDFLVESDVRFVRDELNYGRFAGMGQWRNSGKGRFLWQELQGGWDGPVIGGNFDAEYPGGYEEFRAEFPACAL